MSINLNPETVFPETIALNVERMFVSEDMLRMESWGDAQNGMPNIFNRTAIFSGEKSKDGAVFSQKNIPSYIKNCEIKYTGPSLDKKDYQVFQLCCHASKNNNVSMGELFKIFPAEWLKILKRTDNSRSRDELAKSLKKLTSANINVIKKIKTQSGIISDDFCGTLLSGFKRVAFKITDKEVIRTNKKTDVKWLVAINPCIKELFYNDLTLIDIKKSAEIKSCLGLWLHDFYSSHHNPIPISTKRLYELSGASSTISHFNQSLEINLKKLCEVGFLRAFYFSKNDKSEKVLSVEKMYKTPIIGFSKEKHHKTKNNINFNRLVL